MPPPDPFPPPEPVRGRIGSIRGRLEIPAGATFPAEWTLEVRPDPSVHTETTGATRSLELDGAEREFTVDQLPAAGYRVRAIAEGFRSRAQPVLLAGKSLHPYVILRAEATGFLEGDVVEPDGRAVEGLELQLLRDGESTPRLARTDAVGAYRFDDLPEGRYRLSAGDPKNPLVETRNLLFHPPSMRQPQIEVPTLGTIKVRVLDKSMRPVPGARVQGTAKGKGLFVVTADEHGEGWAHYLAAGTYRVYAYAPKIGRGRGELRLLEGSRGEIELILR